MTTPAATTPEPDRDWWVLVGMTMAAASAAVASFSGLRGLAEAAGWPNRLAWLLPLTIDAYAMTSARVWLAATTRTTGARRFARANALGAITASTAGNAAYHAIGAGLLTAGWPIVVAVGAVPATVLGLTAHLHALRGRTAPEVPAQSRTEPGTESRTGDRPQSRTGHRTDSRTGDGPASGGRDRPESRSESRTRARTRSGTGTARRRRSRTDAELLAAGRDADARHRADHGRPITRDALRAALRISGPRATELRRRLLADPAALGTATPDVPDRKEAVTT
jgi:hypothetical protein